MPPRPKGPRLWLRPAGNGRESVWLILDGPRQRSTGCGPSDSRGAESALSDYIREKHGDALATAGTRDPANIPIADVVNLYLRDVAPHKARPLEITDRLMRVLDFFGARNLDYVSGATCRAYVKHRNGLTSARRELEDFRAAINHHRNEGLHDRLVSVVLPDRSPRRERWLTRKEAATLIRAAWRYRERQNHRATDRATRKHVARFMVVARYMGSRAGVICSASLADKRPVKGAWVDLETGIFYGRPAGERETKKKKQLVKVPPHLLAHMRRWKRRGQRYVVQWNGKPVKRINKAHNAVCEAAGMPDVTPHVWRHSVATWLLDKGVRRKEVADYLAMSESVLERVYSHVEPGRFDDVFGAL